MNYLLILISFLALNLNAQSSTSNEKMIENNISLIDSSLFHGRWHQVEVILTLDVSNGLGSNAEELIKKSIETQVKIKNQILNGELAIITQFNYDWSFTHEIVYSDPKVRFPAWREIGKWSWNSANNTISRKADNMEMTTSELSTVKKISHTELILEVIYTEGESKGIVETIHLKKNIEPKTRKN